MRCIVVALLLALGALAGCEQEPEITANGNTALVAVIGPTEGLDGFVGRQALAGMNWGLNLFPLLDGGTAVQLEMVSTPDLSEPMVAALQAMGDRDDVKAVISLASSEAMLAMAPLANTLEIPVVAAIASNPGVIQGGDFVTQVIYDDDFQGQVAALFVRDELLVNQVAVVSNPDNPYSDYLAQAFSEKFVSIGGEIVGQVQLPGAPADYRTAMARLQQQAPELIYITVGTSKLIPIGKALQQLQWQPRLMGPDGALPSLVKQYPQQVKLFEGMLATDVYTPKSPLTRLGEEYALISAEDLYAFDTYSILGVESLALVAHALEACGEYAATRACMAENIRGIEYFEGVLGGVAILPNGRARRALVVNEIKGGQISYRVRVH